MKVLFNESPSLEFETLKLDNKTSKKVFERTNEIDQIIVFINKK